MLRKILIGVGLILLGGAVLTYISYGNFADDHAEKLAGFSNLIWSIWPPSKRRDGTENDFAQFQTMSLPLESISAPTLAIHGDADMNVSLEQSEYAAQRIENCTIALPR